MKSHEELISEAIEVASNLLQQKKTKECEAICSQILRIDSNNLPALKLIGLVKNYQKNTTEAIEIYRKALAIAPQEYENHNNISICYSAIGQYDKAIEHLTIALTIRPDQYVSWQNLGYQFKQKRDFQTSISCFKRSLELQENNGKFDPQTWVNIAATYGELRKFDEAIYCLKKALEIDPNNSAAHVDLACASFLSNDWRTGWKEYEWRFIHYPHVKAKIDQFDPKKRWDGRPLSEDDRIILFCEQGIGDIFNFVRMIDYIKSNNVMLYLPEELRTFIKRNYPKVTILDNNKNVEYDWYCSIMSLPHLLKLSPEDIDATPYLRANKEVRLGYDDKFKIGIVWAGNPRHNRDRQRSVRLSLFRRIHNLPNVKLFSLQKDVRKRVWPGIQEPVDLTEGCEDLSIIDMSPHIKSWDDTASFIKDMNLIISVDTSVLHLAGALGQQTWGVIPYLPDWRWGASGESTVWYESVRLFRQEKIDDWENVFNRIANELPSIMN